jgi:hypothetical protein
MAMTPTEKNQAIGGLIAFIPYLIIAWGYSKFEPQTSMWLALGVLLGLRAVFGVIEFFGGVLAWRLYGRRKAIKGFLNVLEQNAFPRVREYGHDGVGSYLSRIVDDDDAAPKLRQVARELDGVRDRWDDFGMMAGWRMHSASEAALDIHAPRSTATK